MIQNRPGPRSPMHRPSRRTTARSHCWATLGDMARIVPSTAPTMIPQGLLRSRVTATPSPKQTRHRIAEITLRRGALAAPRLLLVVLVTGIAVPPSLVPSVQVLQGLLGREAEGRGLGQITIRQGREPPYPIGAGRRASGL